MYGVLPEKGILDFLAFGYFLGNSLLWVLADLEEEGAILKWFISMITALIAIVGVAQSYNLIP